MMMRLGTSELSSSLTVPFFKNVILPLGAFLFILLGIVVIAGAGNAVNLTDGLDGLAIVPVMIAAATFGLIAYLSGNANFARYLQIHYVQGAGELAIICGALIGAGLGFLWFNAPPAMIFMGDTGSLALGGALGAIAVATKHEIVLAIVGGLFVLETLSVIIQVASFKLTGKRVFRMAPLHHHFEQKGWKESTVVVRFWIISVVLALVGLATLKLQVGGVRPCGSDTSARRAMVSDPEDQTPSPPIGPDSRHDPHHHLRRPDRCRVRPRHFRPRHLPGAGRRRGDGGRGRRQRRGPRCGVGGGLRRRGSGGRRLERGSRRWCWRRACR